MEPPASLSDKWYTDCVYTHWAGHSKATFLKETANRSHSPYPHPGTKWPCLCYNNHAGWATSFRYCQKNQSVDLPSGIAGAELELTQSKIKVRPVSKYAHISPLTCQLPYLGEPGLLKPLEVTDLPKGEQRLYVTWQEPSDNATEKQKVAWGSDPKRDRGKLGCGTKLKWMSANSPWTSSHIESN